MKPVPLKRVNRAEMKRLNFARQTVYATTGGVPDDFANQVVKHILGAVRLRNVLYYRDPASHYFGVPW